MSHSTPHSAHTDAIGASSDASQQEVLTHLCQCTDLLACRREPSCQQFIQVIRLFEVDGFEKKRTPSRFDPFQSKRPVAAKPDARLIAAKVRQVVDRSPPAGFVHGSKPRKNKPIGGLLSDKELINRIERDLNGVSKSLAKSQPTKGDWRHPLCEDVEIALIVRFEQCWVPAGYSRGALLRTVSLAAGEERTMELFTYDRLRIERERARESSQETSESRNITARASSEVVSQLGFKTDAGVQTEVGGGLSLAGVDLPIDVNGKVGTHFNTEFSSSLTDTHSQLNEATIQAANSLRNIQKTRVVETTEKGTESRTTQRLKNENRCHTLNYHYFEVLEHFDVTLDILDLRMAARIPLPRFAKITDEWLLCHEFPLRRSLLDPIYESGFDAAKLIRSARVFRRMITPPPARPARGTTTRQDVLGDTLRVLLQAITDAAKRLKDVSSMTDDEGWAFWNPYDRGHKAAWKKKAKLVTRDYLESLFTGIFERIVGLENKKDKPGTELFLGFEVFFQQLDAPALENLVTLILGGGYQLRLDAYSLLFVGYDDEGLIGAIDAARKQMDSLRPAPAVADPAAPAPVAEAPPPSNPIDDRIDAEFGFKNLAEAQVELDRLICHLRDHADFYETVIFLEDGSTAIRRLFDACPHAIEFIEPRLLAIQDGHAYFPLRNQEQATRGFDSLRESVETLRADLAKRQATRITLSTGGTQLEAAVGQCSACEDFIDQHRKHDLAIRAEEAQQAVEKTRQVKAEADRLDARLKQTPPLLDDPESEPSALRLDVHNSPAS